LFSSLRIPVLVLPSLPEDPNMSLEEWFGLAEGKFLELRDVLENAHFKRLRRLGEMPKKASDILWWPFTQHDLVAQDSITLIDSRSGENFSIYKVKLLRNRLISL
jgi:dethiobiotin synthetase/adenosylmethionine--8-amino-7-oxononanoate aminotransferase